jgi:phosphatidylglycerophosphate synthase
MDFRRQLPNLLSGLRLALVPALLALAWSDRPTAFLWLFAFSLSTDLLDGFLARRWQAGSELGAKLDSWGDLATYAVFPLCAWWLFREKVVAQLGFVLAAIFAFVAPTLVGLAKFRRITSYHTRAAKAVAIVMGAGLLLFLGFGSPWLFRAAVILLLVEAIEEIAITAVLPKWCANVPSIFSALRIARGAAPVLALALLGFPLGAAAGTGMDLPDLRPEVSDVHMEFNTTAAAGDIAEGCATNTKGIDLLKLSLITQNDGPADMNVGDPNCPDCKLPENANAVCGNTDFICSPAGGHNHPHYNNFLRYELLDPNGVVAATGGKRSFCLAETDCPGHPESLVNRHSCENQGLNAGCYDIYQYTLGCQYVDVTFVPDGAYTLRVTVDPLDRFAEVSEANNVIEEPVLIQRAPIEDVALEGGAVALKVEKVLKLRTKASEVTDLAGATTDPTLFGAALYVVDLGGGSQIGFDLPAGGWKRSGKATAPKGFRYKGDGSDLDPCRSVKVTRKGVKATCLLDGEHAHFELPALGDLRLRLELGVAPRLMCATFGGKTKRNDSVALKRKGAASASCELPE